VALKKRVNKYPRAFQLMASICGTNGTCLTYDALGRMVEKNVAGTATQVVYSPVGKTVVASAQTLVSAYIPLPGGATLYETPSAKQFWHKDWLGSVRLASSIANRNSVLDRAFAPFGELYESAQGGTGNQDFTGDTQDIISGTYDTLNREFNPSQGRWISPDPAGLNSADPMNPQSWNGYSYVVNTPLTAADPAGLTCTDKYNHGSSCHGDDAASAWVILDGVPVPAEFVSQNQDAFVNCPQCGTPQSVNGRNYRLIAGMNGPTWINEANGEEISEKSADELGLSAVPVSTDIGDDAEKLEPGDSVSSSSNVSITMRTPFLVSCKEGEKQYAWVQITGAESISTVGVFNVTDGLKITGPATRLGPPGTADAKGLYYQYFYTTTGGLMTWYFNGTTAKSYSNPSMSGTTKFRAYARESIQCR